MWLESSPSYFNNKKRLEIDLSRVTDSRPSCAALMTKSSCFKELECCMFRFLSKNFVLFSLKALLFLKMIIISVCQAVFVRWTWVQSTLCISGMVAKWNIFYLFNLLILMFSKLPWGGSEESFRSLSQAATCPLVHHQWCQFMLSIGGIICNFIPIFSYLQYWGDEARPVFFSPEQIKLRTK